MASYRYTVWAWEMDPDAPFTGRYEGFDVGGADDSLEALFIARNEADENPAVVFVTVTSEASGIIWVRDVSMDRQDYVGRRDGKPIHPDNWREAVELLGPLPRIGEAR